MIIDFVICQAIYFLYTMPYLIITCRQFPYLEFQY